MESEIITQLKMAVDGLSDVFLKLSELTGNPSKDVENLPRYELLMYMAYLSASDGEISWDETRVISEITGTPLLSPSELAKLIEERNIYSTEFEQKVPLSMSTAVAIENSLNEQGILQDASLCHAMIETYEQIGRVLINADGDVDEAETADFRTYTGMLREYRDKNLKGAQKVTGLVKKGASPKSTSGSGSVTAPKKR